MENSSSAFSANSKKKKFINANAIVIQNNLKFLPKQTKENSLYFEPEDSKHGTEISNNDSALETESKNSLHTNANINVHPIKLHFIRSKDPIGVGRFGIVYKASKVNIKLPKKKSEPKFNTEEDEKNNIIPYLPSRSMAVKIIRNKQVPKTSSESVRIKKNTIAGTFKSNRELSILKLLNHENVIRLFCFSCDDVRKHCVENETEKPVCDHESSTKKDNNLSLFLNFMPTTLHAHLENYGSMLRGDSMDKNKLGISCIGQLFLALEYLRSLNICHRDIKPANILLDIDAQKLKLSDFGCAIQLPPKIHESQLSKPPRLQSYVCSRYYRAPELILGSENYGCEIDIWSAGCVVAEMVTTKPLFPGYSN